ncbi:helix-turn-helix domain-containing protein [Staphylospora marina]|uniref:helix-turn-helix domain-containing protein n=1 Tax=Staphylospora marina TaxID=2490858 RepID=UPI000F5C03B6|nr:helix-turn-helix transcriptional regulator [Staphylospora marina]
MEIKNEAQYKRLKKQLENLERKKSELTEALVAKGYDQQMIDLALLEINMMYERTKHDVGEYERAVNGEFDVESTPINKLGSHLIKLRIYKGLTQEQFGKLLGVSQEQVSRDERKEYAGISIEKLNRILQVLEVKRLTLLPSVESESEFHRRLETLKKICR